ncbi:DUF1311 domain-containing protein [Halomonas sp. TRM85114]|uniref:lysozyme inhibitor LprI family protein n=1 Tax=Halomonas jincaotanensis TaxID=2810616 RepID=UPI001BD4D7D4|nr:lysozyme inhibitor LprI family protein [Halomonas jincaotanensis]MBS9402777.1 DUF1311 domain-containing protein [Halomonas jincaotanensis]
MTGVLAKRWKGAGSVFLLAVTLPAQAWGQTVSNSHPIALQLDSCMAESPSGSRGMLDCAKEAEAAWEEEVERLTERLSSVLGEEAREALESSDLAWRASHDADLTFIDAYHDQLEEAELGDPELVMLSRQIHRNAGLEIRVSRLENFLAGLEDIPDTIPEERIPPP